MHPSWISGGGATSKGFHGHTSRKYESLEKQIVQGCVPGHRNRGRQRRRWTDDIAEGTGMKINEVATAAEDRDHWRGILRAANPSYGLEEGTERRRCIMLISHLRHNRISYRFIFQQFCTFMFLRT